MVCRDFFAQIRRASTRQLKVTAPAVQVRRRTSGRQHAPWDDRPLPDDTKTAARRSVANRLMQSIPRAQLLSDTAIYQRTPRGQRALLQADDLTASPALRMLARVNGYTDLRRLVDLAADGGPCLAQAIEELVDKGWIQQVD